jgi:hypothetical protein
MLDNVQNNYCVLVFVTASLKTFVKTDLNSRCAILSAHYLHCLKKSSVDSDTLSGCKDKTMRQYLKNNFLWSEYKH